MLEGIEQFEIEMKDSGVLHFADLPFEAKRIYWLSGAHSGRGAHAHKELLQVFLCISGEATVMFSDGNESEVLLLQENQGVIVSKGLWRDILPMNAGDTLMVLASEPFDESDYIRDFDQFLRWKNA